MISIFFGTQFFLAWITYFLVFSVCCEINWPWRSPAQRSSSHGSSGEYCCCSTHFKTAEQFYLISYHLYLTFENVIFDMMIFYFIQVMRELVHPNLVNLKDIFLEKSRLLLVMELMQVETRNSHQSPDNILNSEFSLNKITDLNCSGRSLDWCGSLHSDVRGADSCSDQGDLAGDEGYFLRIWYSSRICRPDVLVQDSLVMLKNMFILHYRASPTSTSTKLSTETSNLTMSC